MKRFIAVLTVMLLILSLTAGIAETETQWCYFSRPEGVEMYALSDFSTSLAPEGLEGMYDVMADARDDSYVHIFRMPNGRVLVSVASYTVGEHGTVQDLYDNWDSIAAGMGQEALSMDTDISCASIETRYGFDALCIKTKMVPLSDPSLTLIMEGAVFYDGIDIMETWTVYPVETIASNLPLLQKDLLALQELQESFEFKGLQPEDLIQPEQETPAPAATKAPSQHVMFTVATPSPAPEATEEPVNPDGGSGAQSVTDVPEETKKPSGNTLLFQPKPTKAPEDTGHTFTAEQMENAWKYIDPDGYFSVCLPEGAKMITPETPEDELAAEQKKWEALFGEGAELFDIFCRDMELQDYKFASCPEYGVAIQFFRDGSGDFAAFMPEDYLALEDNVVNNLTENYGPAESIQDQSIETISGIEHASMGIVIQYQSRFLLTLVNAATDQSGALREIDLFLVSTSEAEFPLEYATMLDEIMQSVEYLK